MTRNLALLATFLASFLLSPAVSATDLGKVADSQGVASIRPKQANRWSAATQDFVLKPGDWLRTDARGANALKIRLTNGHLILGPGTLVEAIGESTFALLQGEMEAAPDKNSKFEIRNSKFEPLIVEKRTVVAVRDSDFGFRTSDLEPNWLLGFKGAVTTESMGSLLANVEGRNTPLTIGYHKVSVDIRDQIARTTIEESFVNHTKSRLEGVFYFPLPQDASIAGFGMWIGGELVEADVVEKQRAREIYETILRERRDPGLLEWTGGNLFKARVFPIEPRSEKRIKITYTRVLTARNGTVRYSYPLQSEMLRQNPLRELGINVRVHSALPIRAFACPTHNARISQTAHSAQAEFTAQEYTPERDFEVEFEVGENASPVVVIPHRRGEDGYFLALISPPAKRVTGPFPGAHPPQPTEHNVREVVPDGDPLRLLVLADTSGSMNETARANQDAFLGALLGSLGPDDEFRLAACDTELTWFGGDGPDEARDWLAKRPSLGWTDLDKSFDAIEKSETRNPKSEEKSRTHVVYVGDGVTTTGNADPVAFANRLREKFSDFGSRDSDFPVFHAIAPSSSFESVVLNAIASLGGGSVRRIQGTDTPGAVADQLLLEMSQPGLRDLEVEFEGITVARVYPERLPNVPDGAQQLILGRYLPGGGNPESRILVSGLRDGERVQFSAPFDLTDDVSGNSFIPRLWARMHLDHLLQQGRTPRVKEDVIALSEEFHIMTPYTSFLVLESDADRERFGVKRRFRMRDGERFFTDGRDAAKLDLLQQQMRVAGTWRLNLRRQMLRELGKMGRTLTVVPRQPAQPIHHAFAQIGHGGRDGYDEFRSRREDGKKRDLNFNTAETFDADAFGDASGDISVHAAIESELPGETTPHPDDVAEFEGDEERQLLEDLNDPEIYSPALTPAHIARTQRSAESASRPPAPSVTRAPAAKEAFFGGGGFLGNEKRLRANAPIANGGFGGGGGAVGQSFARVGHGGKAKDLGYHWHWSHLMQGMEALFPAVGGPAPSQPQRAPDHSWPAEAIQLADGLLRRENLTSLQILTRTETHDTRWETLANVRENLAMIGENRWLTRESGDLADTMLRWWIAEKERGALSQSFQLGRVRKPAGGDELGFAVGLPSEVLHSLADVYGAYEPKLEAAGEGRVRLTLSQNGTQFLSFVVDTQRNVVVRREQGGFVDEVKDFVEFGGVWWPTRVERRDKAGKLLTVTTRKLEPARPGGVRTRPWPSREDAILLRMPLPNLDACETSPGRWRRRV